MEWIHAVLRNLVRTYNIKNTYIEKGSSCSGILAVTVFVIISTKNGLKCYSLDQLVFYGYLILMIKNMVGLELIRQQK